MTNSDYVLKVLKIFTNRCVGCTEAELLACIDLLIQLKNYKHERSEPGFHTLIFNSKERSIRIEFIVKKGIVSQTFIIEKLGDKWEQVG